MGGAFLQLLATNKLDDAVYDFRAAQIRAGHLFYNFRNYNSIEAIECLLASIRSTT